MGLFDWLLREIGHGARAPSASAVAAPSRAERGAHNDALRNSQPLYAERGWQICGNTLYGWYRTRYGAFEGVIEQPFGAKPKYMIIKPPDRLLSGPHGACFTQRSKNRFEVHWNTRPSDVNAGILRLEHTLTEALQ